MTINCQAFIIRKLDVVIFLHTYGGLEKKCTFRLAKAKLEMEKMTIPITLPHAAVQTSSTKHS